MQQQTDAKPRQTQDINNTNDPQKKYRLGTVSKNILLEGLNWFHCVNHTLSSDVNQTHRCYVCMNRVGSHVVSVRIHCTEKNGGLLSTPMF